MFIKKRLIAFLLFTFGAAFAAVQPAGIFTDGTVLQCDEPVRIWGTAEPGEEVTVEFAEHSQKAVADKNGKWMITLAPMPASSDARKITFTSSIDNQKSLISNVLVGEVWLAGGQSNMASMMRNYSKTTQPDIDSANDPLLRMVTIPRLEFAGQNNDTPQWLEATPKNVSGFSASAYYFAKNLRETLNVPVGIVTCCVGATPAEAWMSRETLESTKSMKRIVDAYETGTRKNFPTDADYEKQYQEYLEKQQEYLKTRQGPRPQQEMGPKNYRRPFGLYETMLSQTIPYTVRGAIWYQGENNANSQAGHHYREVFPALINEWRKDFMNPNMPFLFVQLATYGPAKDETPYWPELRDAQKWVEKNVDNTGMIVLTDGGEEKNIHPHSKPIVGKRLSLLARKMVYGEKDLVARGPKLSNVEKQNGSLCLSFENTGSGLVLKDEPISAFEIAGKDEAFVPADAELSNGKIIVSSKEVTKPEMVRYGWKKWFIPTLFNEDGLPASPFSTDPRPQVTEGRFYLDTL